MATENIARIEIDFSTAPLASSLRGAGGGAVEKSALRMQGGRFAV
jgi:hypothetical protein